MSLIARLHTVVERASPARPIAFLRIMIGIAAVLKLIDVAGRLWRLSQPSTVRIPWFSWLPGLHEGTVIAVLAIGATASILFVVGWKARVMGLALAVALAAILLADQQLYSNHLYLLTMLVALTAISKPDAAWSLSAGRDRAADWVTSSWAIELIRVQISVVYVFAALSKLNGPFLSGSIVGSTMGNGLVPVPGFMTGSPMVEVLSVAVVLVELSIGVLIWIPRHRAVAIGLGVVLHLSITLTMSPTLQLAAFSVMMLGSYVLFLDARPHSAVAVWDDRCSFCAGAKSLLQRLDGFRVVDWLGSWDDRASVTALGIDRDAADRAMQLIHADEGRSSGYDAITEILSRGPATYLVAPFLRLPPIRVAGARLYRRFARRRRCLLEVSADEPAGASFE